MCHPYIDVHLNTNQYNVLDKHGLKSNAVLSIQTCAIKYLPVPHMI